MSRYIDADALLMELDMTEDISAYDAVVFEEMVNEQPTADVRENVHGEWIEYRNPHDAEPIIQWKCNRCFGLERKKSDYCPNCGAEMKGANTVSDTKGGWDGDYYLEDC